jgi:hypothetical protein
MDNEYFQDEINEIVMSKDISEFYIAIIDRKKMSDEELYDILSRNATSEEEIEELKNLYNSAKILKMSLYDYLFELIGQIDEKSLAILTMIDDRIYNVPKGRFLDTDKNKIIHYEPLSNYLDSDQFSFTVVDAGIIPEITEDTALLAVTREQAEILKNYYEKNSKQEEEYDLTEDFIEEASQYTKVPLLLN